MKFSAILLTLFFGTFLNAQTASKTFDESYEAAEEVNIVQSRGPLTILPATDGKVRVVTKMSVEAKQLADATNLLAKMGSKVTRSSSWLNIRTGMDDVRSWTQRNNNLKVVFKDGDRFDNIRNFDLSTTIYLPPTQKLALEARFERIQADPGVKIQDLDLVLHNGQFRAGSITGNLELDVRFGEIDLENVGGRLTGSLHNVKGDFGDVGDVDIDTRFSKLKMGHLKSLRIDSQNDRLETKSITGSIDIEDRFGTYLLGSTGDAKIDTHNGTFEIESGREYRIEGRFGNFDFDRIDDLIVRDSHNCDYDIKELGSVSGSGKFTEFDVERLGQKAELELDNGHLRVEEVSPQFTGIEVEGSFFEVKLDFRSPADYRVLVDLTFGSVHLPDNLVLVKKIKEFSKVEMELNTPNVSTDSPVISIKGQNGKLYID